MNARLAAVLLLAAAPAAAQELDLAPPLPQPTARVRVHLISEAPGAELYDATLVTRLCRAPCGIWLDVDATRTFSGAGRRGARPSSPFTIDDALVGDVDVRFTPRDALKYGVGFGLTLTGAIVAGIGVVSALVWFIGFVAGNVLINLFGLLFGFCYLFLPPLQFLYVAAAAVGIGAVFLAPGIPILVDSRERLDVMPRE
jgi:hypothetical protein